MVRNLYYDGSQRLFVITTWIQVVLRGIDLVMVFKYFGCDLYEFELNNKFEIFVL